MWFRGNQSVLNDLGVAAVDSQPAALIRCEAMSRVEQIKARHTGEEIYLSGFCNLRKWMTASVLTYITWRRHDGWITLKLNLNSS